MKSPIEIWQDLPLETKEKLIEKINKNSEYQWKPNFWTKVYFERIPPILRQELEKELRKKKF